MADRDFLYRLRTDAATQAASLSTHPIELAQHEQWLAASLGDTSRMLFIAEEAGVAVATVRVDFRDGVGELSWAVAPEARGRGVGSAVVGLAAERVRGPLVAVIKADNQASIRVALKAGFEIDEDRQGVLRLVRHARSS